MTQIPRRRRTERVCSGFTLIELLVVIAIIALLIGILLPALGRARDSARGAICLTNQRQLVTALTLYATEFKGRFPINVFLFDREPELGLVNGEEISALRWYDAHIIGRYLPNVERGDIGDNVSASGLPPSVGGGVMICPNHPEAGRSYSMNHWASSAVQFGIPPGGGFTSGKRFVRPGERNKVFGESIEGPGTGFDSTAPFTSRLMLIMPGWGQWIQANDTDEPKAFTQEKIGGFQLPGERFGFEDTRYMENFGGWETEDGVVPYLASGELDGQPSEAMNLVKSGLPYYRHPGRRNQFQELDGNIHVGFADGSVRAASYADLVDPSTRRSTYELLWTPDDERIENDEYGD